MKIGDNVLVKIGDEMRSGVICDVVTRTKEETFYTKEGKTQKRNNTFRKYRVEVDRLGNSFFFFPWELHLHDYT